MGEVHVKIQRLPMLMGIRDHTRVKSFLALLAVAVALILADQGLKRWCQAHFKLYEHRGLLTYQVNRGLATGIYSNVPTGHGDLQLRYIPAGIFLALLILAILSSLDHRSTTRVLGFCFLLSGGASNLWDHWNAEWVVETFRFPLLGSSKFFPANLADLWIFFGALLISACILRDYFGQVGSPKDSSVQS